MLFVDYIRCVIDYYNSGYAICHVNDDDKLKLYNEYVDGYQNMYIYSTNSNASIYDIIITGLISNVNDIQVIDDTPDNMDLSEITLKKVSFAE